MPENKISLTPEPAPKTTAPELPKAPTAATPTPADAAGFQNIFSKQKTEVKTTKLIDSVLAKNALPQLKPILGKAPTLQKSLEDEREFRQKKKLRLVQSFFTIVFFLALGIVGYFYSELSPSFDLFGPNTTARLTDVNRNLRGLQTQLNKYRYLMAQLDLNAFSLVADDFLDKTSQMASGKVVSAASLSKATQDLPNFLTKIRQNLGQDIVIPLFRSAAEPVKTEDEIRAQFQSDLKQAITDDRKKIADASELTDVNRQELRLMDNALKLVGNTKLLNAVKSASVESFGQDLDSYIQSLDPLKRQELQKLISTFLASTKSEVATIGALKNSRINWSSIIKDIEEVTITVDRNFGKGLTETLGEGIIYTGYEFEANTNKIVLSGLTLTNNAYNFTTISRLIEALEKDPHFKNVEMRSFAKSGSPEEGYSANFKIDLGLEMNGESGKNKSISLQNNIAASGGIKRTK